MSGDRETMSKVSPGESTETEERETFAAHWGASHRGRRRESWMRRETGTACPPWGVLLDHLAAATMPRGLVGWGGELFVIVRQPWDGGDWRVLRIDVVRDEVLGTALLPSRAAALFAMPDPETWAFYEAERLSVGYMTNPSVWLVPAGEILGVDGESQVCPHGQ